MSIGLPERLDIQHKYSFYTKEYGIPRFWYKDTLGNYWAYTNAPENSLDMEVNLGEPLLDLNQPLPHINMAYFTESGLKRNTAVPDGIKTNLNPKYNKKDLNCIWYEYYLSEGKDLRFVYLDSDVKENPCLWVQQQLRSVDAGLPRLRQLASKLLLEGHPKDKMTGLILMLVDQALFSVEELVQASVGDLVFNDRTVKLFDRLFLCDDAVFDFLTILTKDKEPGDPLFLLDTAYGKYPLGKNYVYSVFYSIFVSPVFLKYWHANHYYSRILNRQFVQNVDPKTAEQEAKIELANILGIEAGVEGFIDIKLQKTLLGKYSSMVVKSTKESVLYVDSTLTSKKPDEQQFSDWLHAEPLHMLTPSDEAAIEQLQQQQQVQEASEGAQKPEEVSVDE